MLHSPPHAGRFSPEVLWGQAVEPGFSFHINAQPFTVACYPDRGLPAGFIYRRYGRQGKALASLQSSITVRDYKSFR